MLLLNFCICQPILFPSLSSFLSSPSVFFLSFFLCSFYSDISLSMILYCFSHLLACMTKSSTLYWLCLVSFCDSVSPSLCLSLSIYIYVYVYLYIFVYVYTYVYIYIYLYMCAIIYFFYVYFSVSVRS